MKRVSVLLLLLALGAGLSQDARSGSAADITVTERGPEQPTLVEVRTDPALTKNSEMMLYIYPREVGRAGGFIKRLEPPVEPGLYRFEVTLPHVGEWGINPRYGIGLDLYYTSFAGRIDPAGAETFSFARTFRGDLGADTPAYIQPLGFSIFGVVLVTALGLVVAVLRWLGRQEPRTVNG